LHLKEQGVLITLDNRRLYALQRFALQEWPAVCLAKGLCVGELTPTRLRAENRKFTAGELIERTEAEAKLFFDALPSMGALYTMYPVLVLQDVTGDVHPYWYSGWCFSEFASSLLTRKLDEYSSEAIADYENWLTQGRHAAGLVSLLAEAILNADIAPRILELFDADLNEKKFFADSDRETVRDIVHGYVLIRQLSDAVMQGTVAETTALLAKLWEKGLTGQLDHAVDASLDTLLHKAVSSGNADITQLLLDAGSSPAQLNLRGDRPDQWFMLPRCSAAAQACRAAPREEVDGYKPLLQNQDSNP